MELQVIMDYFVEYGPIAIYLIVLMEYLNLPGFPAGVIMPAAGIWAAGGGLNFFVTILITVLAGLTGSILLYALGRGGGEMFLQKYYRKFPKQQKLIEDKIAYVQQKGSVGIFISKLIPMVRTLISIPAGIVRMNFVKYVISSTLGILVWNLVFVGAGYFLGDTVLTMF
ncbi:MAG: DedA family protein [Lachnospiraceae bacterium]|nr:DedA family protein [Lachnospiraceae bacterium]